MHKLKSLPFTPRLIDDKVLVELKEPPDTTKGGIVIPDNAKDRRAQIAFVHAAGPGRWLVHENGGAVRAPMQVKRGDVVLCGTYAGTAFNVPELDRKDHFRILPEDQILTILDDYEA